MTNFLTKIRLIYIPFLTIAICFISVYSFLNWLLIINLQLFSMDEQWINLWLPLALPCVPIYIWLRPRVRLMRLKTKKNNLPSLYFIVASLAISVPTLILQTYLTTATGKLTALGTVSQITAKPLTKYYTLHTHVIDKKHLLVYRRAEISGRYNEYLNWYIYVICPITSGEITEVKNDSAINFTAHMKGKPLIVVNGVPDSTGQVVRQITPGNVQRVSVLKGAEAKYFYGDKDTKDGIVSITLKHPIDNRINASDCPAWLGLEFNKQVSNHLNDAEKEERFKEFNKETAYQFDHENLDDFTYLDRIGVNDHYKGYRNAFKSSAGFAGKYPVIFEARNGPFEARNGDKLPWVFRSFGIGAAIWLLMIAFPKINQDEVDKLPENAFQADWDSFRVSMAAIRISENLTATTVLIGLNVLIFLVMVFAGLGFMSFDARDLYKWGADFRPAVQHGQWWRLFTSMFLHIGVVHLFMNMYGLLFAGIMLEPIIGRAKYILAYLVCGVIASIASITWHPEAISAGASGAIFGLYGVLTALLTTNKASASSKKGLIVFCLIFIVLNLVTGLTSGVDNAAHIGGLVSGVILGYILYFFIAWPPENPSDDKQHT